MKNIVKTTLILTLVALLCGALIGVAQFVTGPIIESNSEKRANEVYQKYFENLAEVEEVEINGDYVYAVLKVKDENKKLLGYIFKGKDVNGFGLVDLIVVADVEGKLIGTSILQTENTAGIYDKHINTDNSLKAVIGNNVTNLNGVDAQAGATVTQGSLNAILKEVKKVAPDYMDVEAEETLAPHEVIFGEGSTAEVDNSFAATELVTKKEIIKDSNGNEVGYTYTATNYRDIPFAPNAELTLVVGISAEGKVLGIVEAVNNHTQGENFYLKYKDTVANIKDIDVKDLSIDLETGATVSHGALTELFNAIIEAEGY